VAQQLEDFDPRRPTVLFCATLSDAVQCGGTGINVSLERIRRLRLEANVAVALACDVEGEAGVVRTEFATSNIIEVTDGSLQQLFGRVIFPSALIIAPDGNILRYHPAPFHNPLTPELLLRYLRPLPRELRGGRPLRALGKRPLLEVGSALERASGDVLLVDGVQKVLFSLDPEQATCRLLWSPSDSLRYHPALQLSEVPETFWRRMRQNDRRPLVAIEHLLRNSADTLEASAYLLTAEHVEKEGQSGWSFWRRAAFVMLRLRDGDAEVLSVNLSPPIAPSGYTVGHWGGGYEREDTVWFFYGTERGWERLPLPCNSSGIAKKVTAEVFVMGFSAGMFSVFSPKLQAIQWFQLSGETARIRAETKPGGALLQLLSRFDSLAQVSYAEGVRIAREMEIHEEPTVLVKLPLQTFVWKDSVLCISLSELKAKKLTLQSYVPRGLEAEQVLTLEPPNPESELVALHVVPVTGRNALAVLGKWKPEGWYVYWLPMEDDER